MLTPGQKILQAIYNLFGSIVIWWLASPDIDMLSSGDLGKEMWIAGMFLILALIISPTLQWLLQDYLPVYNRDKFDPFRYFGAIAILIIVYPLVLLLIRVAIPFSSFTDLAYMSFFATSGMILWSILIIRWKKTKAKNNNRSIKRKRYE